MTNNRPNDPNEIWWIDNDNATDHVRVEFLPDDGARLEHLITRTERVQVVAEVDFAHVEDANAVTRFAGLCLLLQHQL